MEVEKAMWQDEVDRVCYRGNSDLPSPMAQSFWPSIKTSSTKLLHEPLAHFVRRQLATCQGGEVYGGKTFPVELGHVEV